MAAIDYPTAFTGFPIPRAPGSTEKCMLTVTRATAEYFGLWSLPVTGTGSAWPADGGRAYRPCRRTKQPGYRYRIAYPAPDHPRGIRRARFCLQKGHTQQTLQVLADHLDAVGVPWLWLTDDNGARLSQTLFHSKRHLTAA